MVSRKKPGATAPATRATRGKAKATVSTEIEQPGLGSSVRLGSPIDELSELEAGLSNKRRKTVESAAASVTTRAQKISVQIAASGSNGSSAVSSASSVTHSGEGIDTPATTISTDSVGRGKTMLKTVTERLGGAEDSDSELTTRRRSTRFSRHCAFILDSEERVEERGEDSADESEEDEFQPSEDDSDEYAEIEEEIPTSSRGRKGKGKARAAPIASSSTRTITFGGDSELSDVPDSEIELDDEVEIGGAAVTLPPHGALVRVPRHRGGRGLSRSERQMEALYAWHPELRAVWDNLNKRKKIQIQQDPQPEGLTLTMLPFQLEGLHWMRNQEKTDFGGGILADEMGMGKTIQTIALLMAEPRHKPNLVVAPTVALIQWRNEIEKHTANALSVTVFHGASRSGDTKVLKNCDVIMTTYSVLESMYRKQQQGFKRKDGLVKENSVLHKIQFHRVILDEAHNIKDRTCNTAKAVFALKTKHKLCLSGTPLQNRIGEFFSLLRFLEADPFSYYFCRRCQCKSLHWKFSDHRTCDDCGHRPMDHCNWFNAELLKPIQQYGNVGEGEAAFGKLRKILGHLMLRRTKVEKADDLGLPPRIVRIRRDYFNEEELDLYDSIYGESRRKFDTYVAQGVVLNNYANIFTLITRMRQLADHPDLVLRKHAEEGQNTLVCCICDDEAEEAIASKCHHKFCRLCVSKYIESYDGEGAPDCPQCHVPLSIDLTQPAIEDFSDIKKGSIINRIDMNNWKSSTKIEALVEELYKLRSKTQTIKSIVFSQFTSMLQLVEWRLHRGGFKTVMLEGSMSPPQRDAVIKHFMENVSVEVFLVSLKAGGVALNLTEASQVFILDPWWNPSVEWQSGDRVHRIGQKRSCKITRLVIEDSIESRIIELQEKKARMIHATVNGDQKSMDKLTPADMQFLFQN